MKKNTYILFFLLIGFFGFSQVSTVPNPAEANGVITINFDKTGTPMASYSGTIYAHIGLTVNGNQWQNVIGSWGNNSTQPALTHVSGNVYELVLTPDLFTYFGVPETSTITQICVVFRATAGSPQTQDYFINVGAFHVNLTTPLENSATLVNNGGNLNIAATNTGGNASYTLKSNGVTLNTNTSTSNYSYTHTNIIGNQNYELIVTQGTSTITKYFSAISSPGVTNQAMPAGLEDGINYDSTNTGAYLVLDAPSKDFVYVAGSFNNWQPDTNYLMKVDPASGKYWLYVSNLTPGEIYTYQYWVCDNTNVPTNAPKIVKTADPYSPLVLSPFDDPWIPASSYPNMPAYPQGQEREVTVLQTGQTPFAWSDATLNFVKPDKDKLVIYEVLIRDFDSNRNYQDLINKIDYFKNLNVNAIQLMPVMEYEGNESWGYNTAFHMALDKFYGTPDKLKEFVDLCHQNGIAVILDLAINHAFGRSPLVRMWMSDPNNDGWGDPNAENPYFNVNATHSYNVGSDFNHQRPRTKYYTKRVLKHWIEEYKIDGFRWDLTKGFTQNCPYTGSGSAQDNCTNSYQADRVAVLKEYADYSWSLDSNHYVIFEHLGQDNEEKEWADYRVNEGKGIMLWGKMTDPYNQLTMGHSSNSNINRMGHVSRGFNAPRLVGYAESHDEERLMYKNLEFGNSTNSSHNVKNLNVALSRMSALGAVSLTIPGPKMIWHFGDLGWELSINTCNNGTVNTNCKLDTKPQPQWENNWLGNTQRNKIYSDWSKMIDLKVNEPVFSGSYTINSGNLTPKIYIWDNNLPSSQLKNVVILANFDVNTQNISPDFPYTGTWYNLMDNTPINVTNTTAQISIEAGGFRIYGNQQALLSTNDNNFTETVSITPNPSRGYFSLNTSVNKVEVYSITGQLIKSFEGYPEGHHYDINDLNSGMYIVKAINDSNQEKTMKLIKQ